MKFITKFWDTSDSIEKSVIEMRFSENELRELIKISRE